MGHMSRNCPHQPEGKRAQPGADLDDDVVGAQLRGRDDAANRVRVVHEVLAELLRRGHPELAGQLADLNGSEEVGLNHR